MHKLQDACSIWPKIFGKTFKNPFSYVPVKDVQFAFEIITENFPDELKPLIDYSENYYVGRARANSHDR
jgi:hypothetical protein